MEERRKHMESSGQWNWNQHWMDWLTHCHAIAASDLFIQTGHPEDQVTLLKATPASGGGGSELARDLSLNLRTVAYGVPPLSRPQHDGG